MLHRTVVFILLAFCFIASSAHGQNAPVARLSSTEAIATATHFCERIGANVAETPVAQFPMAPPFKFQKDLHWQQRWKIKFGTQIEIHLVDATGVICYFEDAQALKRAHSNETQEIQPLSEADAVRRATNVLQATGPREPVSLYDTRLNLSAEKGAINDWEVSWQRHLDNIPYRDSSFNMHLNAVTGEVIGFCMTFSEPPAILQGVTPLLQVSKEQAAQKALMLVRQASVPDAEISQVETIIASPNTFWQVGGSQKSSVGYTRPVWACRFTQNNQAAKNVFEVWIDTQSGDVVGGVHSNLLGRKAELAISPMQILGTAKEARLYRRGKTGSWPSRPQSVLTATATPEVFKRLRQGVTFTKDNHLPLGNLKLIVVGADKTPVEFNYDISAGRLMYNGQGCVVAPELAAQMKALASDGVKTPRH